MALHSYLLIKVYNCEKSLVNYRPRSILDDVVLQFITGKLYKVRRDLIVENISLKVTEVRLRQHGHVPRMDERNKVKTDHKDRSQMY